MNNLPVGQSVDEALCLVQAFEFMECLFSLSLGEVLMWCGSLPVVRPPVVTSPLSDPWALIGLIPYREALRASGHCQLPNLYPWRGHGYVLTDPEVTLNDFVP